MDQPLSLNSRVAGSSEKGRKTKMNTLPDRLMPSNTTVSRITVGLKPPVASGAQRPWCGWCHRAPAGKFDSVRKRREWSEDWFAEEQIVQSQGMIVGTLSA